MEARRLARWVIRALVVGALAFGAIYAANAASADESPAQDQEMSTNGVVWS
jgi:hypothetical protein